MTQESSAEPFVDLRFRIQGQTIPADHGYPIFSALTQVIPQVHLIGGGNFGVHPISGRLLGDRRMAISPDSRLTIRAQAGRIPEFLRIAGKTLPLPGGNLAVGTPNITPLIAAPRLYSRMVTIKLKDPGASPADYAAAFLKGAIKQVEQLGIDNAEVSLIPRKDGPSFEGKKGADTQRDPYLRRTLSIRTKRVFGYAVLVGGLTPENSIRLQEIGMGGRRHFGCGIFIPAVDQQEEITQ